VEIEGVKEIDFLFSVLKGGRARGRTLKATEPASQSADAAELQVDR